MRTLSSPSSFPSSSRPSPELLLSMFRTMARIRAFEERTEQLFLQGKLPGFVHLSIGQEAVAAGVCAALRDDDYITSTHRGHGHAIAKGADLHRMMAELYGKRTGSCRGKGGSMHIFDYSKGMLGANGVVGGGFPIATGAGLAIKLRGSDQVAVCFFGDGASNRGTFHEALNLCAAWRLPVVFVNENNRFASTTPFAAGGAPGAADGALKAAGSESAVMVWTSGPWPVHSVPSVSVRAQAYGIPGVSVDGNDLEAVYQAARELVERARRGEGPSLLEARTYRLKGHFIGDPERYRTREEVAAFQALEPLARAERRLTEAGWAAPEQLAAIRREAEAEVEAAVRFAEESPLPEPEEALDHLFSTPVAVYPWEAPAPASALIEGPGGGPGTTEPVALDRGEEAGAGA